MIYSYRRLRLPRIPSRRSGSRTAVGFESTGAIGRFGSLFWLVAAAALLPASRRRTVSTTPNPDEGITP
jgi:hypothetical protein